MRKGEIGEKLSVALVFTISMIVFGLTAIVAIGIALFGIIYFLIGGKSDVQR